MVSTKYVLPSAVPETEMIPIQFRKKTRQMKLYHVMSNIGMEKLLVELPFQDLDMMVIALFFTSMTFFHFDFCIINISIDRHQAKKTLFRRVNIL